jgi:hypothetical protein
MTEEEDELLDDLMTAEFRLREHLRQQRRGKYGTVRKGGRGELPEPLPARRRRTAIASTSLRLVVKK